jgi:ubiquinone/menaquinone biosynthesis C-methylase UbiE
MTVMPSDQKALAVDTHSRQAPRFASAYRRAAEDPYSTCFAYSRFQLDRWLQRLVPPPAPGARLLDVGCGTGHQLAHMRSLGYTVAGVDGSAPMLEEARRLNPDAELHQGDVERIPFETSTFDVTLCVEVLRYLPDPAPVLREMVRVLKPGGVCVATAAPVLNLNGYWAVNRLAVALRPRGLTPLRQFFTTAGGLRRAARAAGFGTIEVHGVYLGPINWIERLAPVVLRGTLRAWNGLDTRLADRPLLRELSNMFVMRATR